MAKRREIRKTYLQAVNWLRIQLPRKSRQLLQTVKTEPGGTGTEVNPESWTQLKGSNEKGI